MQPQCKSRKVNLLIHKKMSIMYMNSGHICPNSNILKGNLECVLLLKQKHLPIIVIQIVQKRKILTAQTRVQTQYITRPISNDFMSNNIMICPEILKFSIFLFVLLRVQKLKVDFAQSGLRWLGKWPNYLFYFFARGWTCDKKSRYKEVLYNT